MVVLIVCAVVIIVTFFVWLLGWIVTGRWIVLRRPTCWYKGHLRWSELPNMQRCRRCWKLLP